MVLIDEINKWMRDIEDQVESGVCPNRLELSNKHMTLQLVKNRLIKNQHTREYTIENYIPENTPPPKPIGPPLSRGF